MDGFRGNWEESLGQHAISRMHSEKRKPAGRHISTKAGTTKVARRNIVQLSYSGMLSGLGKNEQVDAVAKAIRANVASEVYSPFC